MQIINLVQSWGWENLATRKARNLSQSTTWQKLPFPVLMMVFDPDGSLHLNTCWWSGRFSLMLLFMILAVFIHVLGSFHGRKRQMIFIPARKSGQNLPHICFHYMEVPGAYLIISKRVRPVLIPTTYLNFSDDPAFRKLSRCSGRPLWIWMHENVSPGCIVELTVSSAMKLLSPR